MDLASNSVSKQFLSQACCYKKQTDSRCKHHEPSTNRISRSNRTSAAQCLFHGKESYGQNVWFARDPSGWLQGKLKNVAGVRNSGNCELM